MPRQINCLLLILNCASFEHVESITIQRNPGIAPYKVLYTVTTHLHYDIDSVSCTYIDGVRAPERDIHEVVYLNISMVVFTRRLHLIIVQILPYCV